MKVLILSCSTGGGHNSCAKYILDELKTNKIEAVYKDFYDVVNVNAKEFSEKVYLSTLAGSGEIFKNIYKLGELYSKTRMKSPVYFINKFHRHTLYKYIVDHEFDVVVATHLFPALTLTAINKYDFPKKIKFITVATDYEPCPFLEETLPNYLVIQKGLEEKFIKKGIADNILLNTGIPVASNFVKKAKNIRDEYNIKDEKLILIMLGSMGFGKISEVLEEILQIDNIKVMVVCGTNQKLYTELEKINNSKLILFGYTDNINDLIYSADIVLSKPGGLSSTEIAMFRKPLLHIFPIPGIETYNTNFFEEKGMSLKCETREEIVEKLNKLLEDTELQKKMSEKQKEFINQDAARELVNVISKMSDN